jgi:hypothetical protein
MCFWTLLVSCNSCCTAQHLLAAELAVVPLGACYGPSHVVVGPFNSAVHGPAWHGSQVIM